MRVGALLAEGGTVSLKLTYLAKVFQKAEVYKFLNTLCDCNMYKIHTSFPISIWQSRHSKSKYLLVSNDPFCNPFPGFFGNPNISAVLDFFFSFFNRF